VPQADVYTTRLNLSSAGLPSAGGSGYNLLDKEGITTSDFKQHVDYQRAIEGELAKTIQSMNGITAASVHLAIPQQTVFNDGTSKPTAAVMLTMQPGVTLSAGQVQSIVNLVASSVADMTPQQVTVTDSTGKLLAAPGEDNSAAAADARTSQTQTYDTQMQTQVQQILDQMVGAGHSVVTVNAVLNFDKNNTTTQKYIYDKTVPPLSSSTTSETYAGNPNSSTANGTLGAGGSNTTGTSTSTTGGSNGSYVKKTETVNNAVGQMTETSVSAPGNVKNLSVAVLVDNNVSQLDLNAVKDLVSRAVGLDTTRGDTIAVQASAFDTSAAQAQQKAQQAATKAATAAKSQAQMMSLIKTGAVVLLVLAVIVMSFLGARRRRPSETVDEHDDLDAFLEALTHNEAGLPPAPIEPLVKSRPAQLLEAHQQRLTELADEDPAAVARLLRGWLNSKDS